MATPSAPPQQILVEPVTAQITPWEVFVENNEIRPDVSADILSILGDTKVVLLLDDSGSMSTRVIDPGVSAFAMAAAGVQRTRWSELEKLTSTVIDMLLAAPTADNLDAYFLNRGCILNVTDKSQIAPYFGKGPSGGTPLCRMMKQLFDVYDAQLAQGKRVLIIVVTDGEPSDGGVNDLFQILQQSLKYGRNASRLFVSFAECNDNEDEMAYLDGWDTQLPHFDNTDDFPMESLRVKAAQRARGERERFTYVDYIVKIMLGAVLQKYWGLDQMQRLNRPIPVYGSSTYQQPRLQQQRAQGGGVSGMPPPPPNYQTSIKMAPVPVPVPAPAPTPDGYYVQALVATPVAEGFIVQQSPQQMVTPVGAGVPPFAQSMKLPQRKEGTARKQGSGFPWAWATRRFVLDRGTIIYYWGAQERGIVRVLKQISPVPNDNYGMFVLGENKKVRMRFANMADYDGWRAAFIEHINWNTQCA